jgi:hypothetical protein
VVLSRLSGPIGLREDSPAIDQGTLARTPSSVPGSVGLQINLGIAMQLKSRKKRRKKKQKTGITVHAKSQISAQEWVKKIADSRHVPDHYQDQLQANGDLISVDDPQRFRVPGNVIPKMWRDDWLSAFVNTEWEMTTGSLDITVTKKSSGPLITVTHNPDLSNGESLGGYTKHTMSKTYHSLHGTEIEKGNTLPTGVTLNSGRKLIAVANRVALKLGTQVKSFAFEDDELVCVWFHEIACHAGRNSQGLPDTHQDDTVDKYKRDIDDDMFPKSTTLPKLLAAMRAFLK